MCWIQRLRVHTGRCGHTGHVGQRQVGRPPSSPGIGGRDLAQPSHSPPSLALRFCEVMHWVQQSGACWVFVPSTCQTPLVPAVPQRLCHTPCHVGQEGWGACPLPQATPCPAPAAWLHTGLHGRWRGLALRQSWVRGQCGLSSAIMACVSRDRAPCSRPERRLGSGGRSECRSENSNLLKAFFWGRSMP